MPPCELARVRHGQDGIRFARYEPGVEHALPVTKRLGQGQAAGDIPHPGLIAIRRGQKPPPIGAEGEDPNALVVQQRGRQLAAGLRVPEPHHSILTASGHEGAIRTESSDEHRPVMTERRSKRQPGPRLRICAVRSTDAVTRRRPSLVDSATQMRPRWRNGGKRCRPVPMSNNLAVASPHSAIHPLASGLTASRKPAWRFNSAPCAVPVSTSHR